MLNTETNEEKTVYKLPKGVYRSIALLLLSNDHLLIAHSLNALIIDLEDNFSEMTKNNLESLREGNVGL